MSFWSSQKLRANLPNLIYPFNEAQIESASYQLCLGDEVYISPLPHTSREDRIKINLNKTDALIPPGQFAFLITAERVKVPKDAIAFISIKFRKKKEGLINVSGFHVDPGYQGKLIFSVYNAGSVELPLEMGDQFFSIWYSDLDEEDDKPRTSKGFNSIPSEFMTAPDLAASIPNLVKRLDDLDKKVEKYSINQAFLVALTLAIFAAILPFVPLVVDKYATTIDRLFVAPLNLNRVQSIKNEHKEIKQLEQKTGSVK
jgi:dCTP deaminase